MAATGEMGIDQIFIPSAKYLTMAKFIRLVFLLLLFSTLSCSAQSVEKFSDDFSIPFQVSIDSVPDSFTVDMYVVYGEKIDSFERMMIDSFTANPPRLKSATVIVNGRNTTKDVKINIKQVSEKDTSLEKLQKEALLVILVGGPTHNNITRAAYDGGYITNESARFAGQLIVGSGKLASGTSVMVLRHNIRNEPAPGEHLEREAVKYSPLAPYIKEEYIPIVASGIGMFLMSIVNLAKAMFESLAGEVGKKRFAYGHKGRRICGVSVRETLALIGAALVLGFAVTWTFAGPTPKFFDLFLLNTAICFVAGLSHDLVHRILGRLFKIRVEYRFWYAGSFITILTAFLGNSFGMQGFLLEKPDEKISKWKYGIMKLAAPIFSIAIAGLFASLYLNKPSVLYQMIYTTASILAMAEIMPVKGLDGYDIREWNRWIYAAAFMAISVVFFAINFVQ
jgi:hypothetical protein